MGLGMGLEYGCGASLKKRNETKVCHVRVAWV